MDLVRKYILLELPPYWSIGSRWCRERQWDSDFRRSLNVHFNEQNAPIRAQRRCYTYVYICLRLDAHVLESCA